jgi:PPP family 3-phenylpropionic acid transporter
MVSRLKNVKPSTSVQVLFVLFGVAVASFFPFLALFLDDRGLSPARIGIVIAAMALARIVANPVWGHVADTTLGRRAVLRIGALGSAVTALALFWVEGSTAILIASVLFAAFSTTTGPNIDAIALAHLGEERMGEYGRIRAWESLSYAISCFTIGAILEATGTEWTMVIYGLGSLAILAWSATVAPDRPTPLEHKGRLGAVGAAFKAAPRFWRFLAAVLLVWTGFNAAWNIFGLKIASEGGGPLLVGIGTALGGLVEVPMMRLSSRAHRSWGLRKAYVLGCCVYALGFLLWGLVDDPTIVSVLTVFEGIGFAFLFTTSVVVIGRMLPASLQSTGQSMVWTIGFGVAPIVGAGLGGIVFETFGDVTLYAIASGLALAGGVAAWLALSEPAVSRPLADAEPVV